MPEKRLQKARKGYEGYVYEPPQEPPALEECDVVTFSPELATRFGFDRAVIKAEPIDSAEAFYRSANASRF